MDRNAARCRHSEQVLGGDDVGGAHLLVRFQMSHIGADVDDQVGGLAEALESVC